jgi:hypothetical protein
MPFSQSVSGPLSIDDGASWNDAAEGEIISLPLYDKFMS